MITGLSFKRILLQLTFSFLSVFIFSNANAQYKLPANAIQIIGGYSRHGSGDYNGVTFGAEYIKYYSKKLSLNYNFRGTINHGQTTIIINNTIDGRRTDASVRFTTAGVQAGVNGGISIIRSRKSEVLLSLGGFGRYQSASNGSDGYQIYYPQATGQPTVLIGYDNRTPQETFSLGAIAQLQYNFTFRNKIYVGVVPGFQTDTNGDAILQVALIAGRRW